MAAVIYPPECLKYIDSALLKSKPHTIPRQFQPKPRCPMFDCHVFSAVDWEEQSNSTARLQNEGDPVTFPPNKNCRFTILKTEPLLNPLADSAQTQRSSG